MRIMSSKAMDEVNKPLGQCRYIVNVVRISYFLSIDFSIWGFDNGKKKKVKHAERHVDYKVSSENLAMPELHIGEDKGEEQPEKKDDGFITYENVAIPEVHIKKRK